VPVSPWSTLRRLGYGAEGGRSLARGCQGARKREVMPKAGWLEHRKRCRPGRWPAIAWLVARLQQEAALHAVQGQLLNVVPADRAGFALPTVDVVPVLVRRGAPDAVSDVDQLQEVGVRARSGVHAKVSVVQQPQRLKVCLHDLVAGLLQYLATSGLPGGLSRLKPAPGPGVPAIRGATRDEPAGGENDAARGAHKVRRDLPPLAEVPDQSQAQGAWPAHLHWADTSAPCCHSRDPLIEGQGAGHTRQGRPERRSAGLAPFGGQEPGHGHQDVQSGSMSKTSRSRACRPAGPSPAWRSARVLPVLHADKVPASPVVTPPLSAVVAVLDALQARGAVAAVGGSGLLAALGLIGRVRDWDVTTDATTQAVQAALSATGLPVVVASAGQGGYATRARFAVRGVGHDVDVLVGFALRDHGHVVALPTRVTRIWRGLPIADPEVWLQAYRLLGRQDRAALLQRWHHERPHP